MAEKNKTKPGFKYKKSRSKLAPKKNDHIPSLKVVSRSKLAPKHRMTWERKFEPHSKKKKPKYSRPMHL